MNTLVSFVICTGLALLAPLAVAAPPQTISYQGYLANSGGTPVNAALEMTFRLYDKEAGGALVWTEVKPSVMVTNGIFNVVLGSPNPIALTFAEPYWLSVQVTGDLEMAPRQPLTSSPYAFRASSLDSAATVLGSQVSGAIANEALPASPTLSGNLTLADPSTASAGNIMKGASTFIHNYGSGNTFVGVNAGNFQITGGSNTAVGASALMNSTSGINSIAMGAFAGGNVTGGIGNIHIGNFGMQADSGMMRIGSGGVQTKTFIAGIRGVTPAVSDALPVVIDSQGQLGTGASSGGTVTSVATGAGLTGGPITTVGTIGLAATQLLPAIACATNQIVKWNGTAWACTNAPSLPTLYTGYIPSGQPAVATSVFDRSTWQVMGVVTPPAGNYYIIARVNGQTESTSGPGAYSTSIYCDLLLEPTLSQLDFIYFTPPPGLGGSIQKLVMASYVTIPAGGSVSVRCHTGSTGPIPFSTMIGSGGHIDAIPVGGQVNG